MPLNYPPAPRPPALTPEHYRRLAISNRSRPQGNTGGTDRRYHLTNAQFAFVNVLREARSQCSRNVLSRYLRERTASENRNEGRIQGSRTTADIRQLIAGKLKELGHTLAVYFSSGITRLNATDSGHQLVLGMLSFLRQTIRHNDIRFCVRDEEGYYEPIPYLAFNTSLLARAGWRSCQGCSSLFVAGEGQGAAHQTAAHQTCGRNTVCPNCMRQAIRRCAHCRLPVLPTDVVRPNGVTGQYWGVSCAQRHLRANENGGFDMPQITRGLSGYGTAACQRINHLSDGGVVALPNIPDCGFELELLPPRDGSIAGSNLANRIFERVGDYLGGIERDASISRHDGIEVVTHYGPFPVILELVDKLCPVLKSHQCRSHKAPPESQCGLHVALGRSPTTSVSTIARYVCFWNDIANRDFLRAFTRRWNTGYCKPVPGKVNEIKSCAPDELHDVIRNSDRYELLNFQNGNRIEIRAFRGTTNRETLRACILLSVWLWKYCESVDSTASLTWQQFVSWCRVTKFTGRVGESLREYDANEVTAYWDRRAKLCKVDTPETRKSLAVKLLGENYQSLPDWVTCDTLRMTAANKKEWKTYVGGLTGPANKVLMGLMLRWCVTYPDFANLAATAQWETACSFYNTFGSHRTLATSIVGDGYQNQSSLYAWSRLLHPLASTRQLQTMWAVLTSVVGLYRQWHLGHLVRNYWEARQHLGPSVGASTMLSHLKRMAMPSEPIFPEGYCEIAQLAVNPPPSAVEAVTGAARLVTAAEQRAAAQRAAYTLVRPANVTTWSVDTSTS